MDEPRTILRRTFALLPLIAACWVVLVFVSVDTEALRPSAVLMMFLSLTIREHLLGNWPGALLAAALMGFCSTPVLRAALVHLDPADPATWVPCDSCFQQELPEPNNVMPGAASNTVDVHHDRHTARTGLPCVRQ